jgi:hypothetical protein
VLGEKAEVTVPSYGILVHGASTHLEVNSRIEIEEKIQWRNPFLEKERATYLGWLKQDLV